MNYFDQIANGHDGPVTGFVAIMRALRIAEALGREKTDNDKALNELGNALSEILVDIGSHGEFPSTEFPDLAEPDGGPVSMREDNWADE